MLKLMALAGALALHPTPSLEPLLAPGFEQARLSGFSTILIAHVNRTLGTENLPAGEGTTPDPGVFVTLTSDALYVFDREVSSLERGHSVEPSGEPGCSSDECPSVLHDVFSREWLRLSLESTWFSVQVPERVHIAVDSNLSVGALLDAAYAVSETRPVLPPSLSILVNSGGRGVRARQVYLVPPEGIQLPRGAAALGFRIRFGEGSFVLDGADSSLGTRREVQDLRQLALFVKNLERRQPNKDVVILEPDRSVTVAELLRVIETVRGSFSTIVLNRGQKIIL